jgi:3D (Asp-Asp-Asp) domain-containing protein
MLGSAYSRYDKGCGTITCTGTTVHTGTVAVDPRVIPLGTRMFIVSADGEYVYGIATAEDTGSSIKDARVDLYFHTQAECFQFGMRDVIIYFLG